MKARTLILTAAILALTVLLASAAVAKKPDHVGKPEPGNSATNVTKIVSWDDTFGQFCGLADFLKIPKFT